MAIPFPAARDIELTIEKYSMQHILSREILGGVKHPYEVNAYLDYTLDSMILRMNAYVACSSEKIMTIQSPVTVWQHIKQDYAPKWFIKKYPVKYKEIKIAAKEAFPELSCLVKDGQRHLHVRVYEQCSPQF
jgi:hypothetical protein